MSASNAPAIHHDPSAAADATFISEMDAVLKAYADGAAATDKIGWAALKRSRPALFGDVSSEQLRSRYRNLTKPNPAATSRATHNRRGTKRKYDSIHTQPIPPPYGYGYQFPHAYASVAASPYAYGFAQPPPATALATSTLEYVRAGKMVDGVWHVMCKFRGLVHEVLVPAATVQHEPAYIKWAQKQV